MAVSRLFCCSVIKVENWTEKCERLTVYTAWMKGKHGPWMSRCSPLWKVCDKLNHSYQLSRTEGVGNSCAHTPLLVLVCLCEGVCELGVCVCSCLHANVDVCLCVCVLGSWTNKGRGPVDEPIKEQEEWGRTQRPSMLCPSLKLEMASGVKTIRMLWSSFMLLGSVNNSSRKILLKLLAEHPCMEIIHLFNWLFIHFHSLKSQLWRNHISWKTLPFFVFTSRQCGDCL